MLVFGLSGGVNILRIMEARYRGALVNYARVLSSICVDVTPGLLSRSQAFKPKLAITEYAWLERMCFCLVALLIQCELSLYHTPFDSASVVAMTPVKKKEPSGKPDMFNSPDHICFRRGQHSYIDLRRQCGVWRISLDSPQIVLDDGCPRSRLSRGLRPICTPYRHDQSQTNPHLRVLPLHFHDPGGDFHELALGRLTALTRSLTPIHQSRCVFSLRRTV